MSSPLSPFEFAKSENEAEETRMHRKKALNYMRCYPSLQLAAYMGDITVVRTLLEDGVDANINDRCFGYPLKAAVLGHRHSIVRALVQRMDHRGGLAYCLSLQAACHRGDTESMQIILDRLGNGLICGMHNKTLDQDYHLTHLLVIASGKGHIQAARLLLERYKADINIRDYTGKAPLITAVRENQPQMFRLLFEWPGVQLNVRDRDSGTPLICAVELGQVDTVRLLLSRPEADPNATPEGPYDVLGIAVRHQNYEIVRLLLQRRDLRPRFREGWTCPMRIALEGRSLAILDMILNSCHVRFGHYRTDMALLFTAIAKPVLNCAEWVRLLLRQRGVNPNQRDELGRTPLFFVITEYYEHDKIIRILLDHRDVDPNLESY